MFFQLALAAVNGTKVSAVHTGSVLLGERHDFSHSIQNAKSGLSARTNHEAKKDPERTSNDKYEKKKQSLLPAELPVA